MFGKIYDIISNKGIVIFVFYLFISHDTIFFTFSKKWKWSTTQRKWGAETSTAASFDSTWGLRQPVRSTWQGPRKNEREAKKDGRLCSGAGTTGYNCLLNLTILMFTVELPLMACKNLYEMTLHCLIWICNGMEMGFIILNAKFFYFHRSWICCPSRVRC